MHPKQRKKFLERYFDVVSGVFVVKVEAAIPIQT